MFKKHPKGLAVLFFTEMWERFGFYTTFSVLALYMDEYFKLPKTISGNIYGIFIACVYLTPLFGGWLADKWLGYGKSIVTGALLLATGFFMLATQNYSVFFIALAVVALGNGFFKPNISTQIGNLYRDNDPLKDSAFNIFYMGINLGALAAPLVASYLRNHYSWGAAFAGAGVGMLLSIVTYWTFKKHIVPVVHAKSAGSVHVETMTKSQEKSRIISLIIVFAISIIFWMAFFQYAFTLTFWARDCTDTTISPEIFQSLNGVFIILFTPPLLWFWSLLRKRGKEPSTAGKLAIGMFFTALCFAVMTTAAFVRGDVGRVSVLWLIGTYILMTLAELCCSPMGLSLVSKMAPPRMRGLMMGGWFVSLSIGSYLSGFLGSFWEKMPHSSFFGMIVASSLVAFVLMLLATKNINRSVDFSPQHLAEPDEKE